jgi:KDO2-lipid IV(A) lauroyltransferase
MNFILASLLIFFIFLIGIIPFFLLYPFADLMYFFLFHVFRYRKKVIFDNLSASFPTMEQQKLNQLFSLSYKNLTDILVEGIKGFTMTRGQISRRHKILNPEIVEPFYKAGKSIIALPTHYGNWEWGALSPGLFIKNFNIIGFYKPFSNPFVDRFMRKNRSRTGTTLASIYETSKTFEQLKDKPTVYIMAADQSPSNAKKAYWVNFLGRNTAFLRGPEKYARSYDIPLVYVDIQRVKRGYYELTLSVLADKPSELAEGEITRRYAKMLESQISRKPENWLWSHKRWKLKR